jgi:hypothetical protein
MGLEHLDTVEENILKLQKKKGGAIESEKPPVPGLTTQELEELRA